MGRKKKQITKVKEILSFEVKCLEDNVGNKYYVPSNISNNAVVAIQHLSEGVFNIHYKIYE